MTAINNSDLDKKIFQIGVSEINIIKSRILPRNSNCSYEAKAVFHTATAEGGKTRGKNRTILARFDGFWSS